MKRLIIMLALMGSQAFAVLITPGSKAVSNFFIASSGTPIALGFGTYAGGSNPQSMMMKNVNGMLNGYSHVMLVNNSGSPISWDTTLWVSGAPNVPPPNSIHRLFVLANSAGAWDNIATFDNLFIQSESGSSITSGTVYGMIW